MFRIFKRTIGICLAGIGLGVLLVILMPIRCWLFLFGIALFVVGAMWLFC